MNSLKKLIDVVVQIGGWALLAAACLVTYDVITRKILNISIAGADEISGYVFAISTACAFSYALLTRSNIRIDFAYRMMPAPLQRVLDVVSMALTVGFLAIVCYFAFNLVSDAFTYGSKSITPLQTPLALPQTLWFAGLCLALATALILLSRALFALLRGELRTVEDLTGIPTIREEIEIETSLSGTDRETRRD